MGVNKTVIVIQLCSVAIIPLMFSPGINGGECKSRLAEGASADPSIQVVGPGAPLRSVGGKSWCLSDFVAHWNSHRVRRARSTECPTGIPEDMFDMPKEFSKVSESSYLGVNDALIVMHG